MEIGLLLNRVMNCKRKGGREGEKAEQLPEHVQRNAAYGINRNYQWRKFMKYWNALSLSFCLSLIHLIKQCNI